MSGTAGGNWHGQLGVGDRDGDAEAPCCRRAPTPIRTALRFRSVVAGGISSCGVAVDGVAYCWGSPQEGRLGTGEQDAINKSADKTSPAAVTSDARFIAVMPRAWHTCGLSDGGGVFCWGGNIFRMESAVPRRVAPTADFVAMSTGQLHDCAVSVTAARTAGARMPTARSATARHRTRPHRRGWRRIVPRRRSPLAAI